MKLQGKVAVITGSGQGIGQSIAVRFAREGARVLVCDINPEAVEEVVAGIREKNETAQGVAADVSETAGVKKIMETAIEQWGTVDILVNNAGITRDFTLHRMGEEQWDKVIKVNLKGAFLCSQAVVPIMKDKGYGRIVNLSSAARFGNTGQGNYAASKSGLVGLTRALAKELAPRNINVNAVAPGFIDTAMSRAVPQEILREKIQLIPMLRQGTVEEVASVCLFLASDESSFITGQVIHVDGGRYMP